MSSSEVVEQIFDTLAAYDPDKTTICVGGAALAVQLAEVGVDVPPQADVDVLCSKDYFAALSLRPAELKEVSKFQIRWPYGDDSVRALSPILDIYPDEATSTLLPFSACEALGGIWYPTYYQDCLNNKDELVTHRGHLFLAVSKLLIWTAVSGREKDIVKVDALLPIARRTGLIAAEEYRTIRAERDRSVALRSEYPKRHHARIDN